MPNNCNLIKSVYLIDSNGIVTGSSTVCRHIASSGLDVKLLERAEILREVLWERDRDKTGDTLFMDSVFN